jgi:phospholipid/cholesterol/gamma-HCH transport system substrate-binding protein
MANLNASTHTASYILDQNKDRVSLVLDQANLLVTSLNSAASDLKVMAKNVRTISDSLSVKQINTLLANLESSSKDLKQVMKQVNSREGSLGKLISDPSLHNQLLHLSGSLDSLAIDLKKNPKRYVKLSLF